MFSPLKSVIFNIHSIEIDWTCTECRKFFDNKDNWKAHMKKTQTSLQTHMSSMSGKIYNPRRKTDTFQHFPPKKWTKWKHSNKH